MNEAELFEQNRAENILFLNQEAEIKGRLTEAEAEVEKIALADLAVAPHLAGLTVRKVIVVKDRIVNIVAG